MKRIKKALIGLAVGTVAALGVVGFAACGDKTETFDGEYHYANAWAPDSADYGVKVKVTVNVNTDKITKVEIVESNYVQATPSWVESETEGSKAYANGGEAELLKKYNGLTVADVLAMKLDVNEDGSPVSNNSDGSVNPDFDASTFVTGETNLLISGATQSSARILLAVQDALADYESDAE